MTVGLRVIDGERRGTVVDEDGDRLRVAWDNGDTQWIDESDVQILGGC